MSGKLAVNFTTVYVLPRNLTVPSRCLAFNIRKLGLFGMDLKPGVGLKFTVEQG